MLEQHETAARRDVPVGDLLDDLASAVATDGLMTPEVEGPPAAVEARQQRTGYPGRLPRPAAGWRWDPAEPGALRCVPGRRGLHGTRNPLRLLRDGRTLTGVRIGEKRLLRPVMKRIIVSAVAAVAVLLPPAVAQLTRRPSTSSST